MTSFFSRNKTFLDNFIMYNRSFGFVFVLFFFPCVLPSFWLKEKRKKKKRKKCVSSPSVLTPCDRDEGKYFNSSKNNNAESSLRKTECKSKKCT